MNHSSREATDPQPATIERIESFILDIPTIRAHTLSMATMRTQSLVIVRIVCSDGTTGVGEGTTIAGLSYGSESPESIKSAIDIYIAPLLRGADANQTRALLTRVGHAVKGNHFAKCAIETALLDALAQRLHLPLAELLGGRVTEWLPVVWTLASGDTSLDIAEAERLIEAGRHNVFKIKIGRRSVAEDVAHVAAIKRALGNHARVRVDVNMAWSEVSARRGIGALADAGCELVEQPVSGLPSLARLVGKYPIAVMADESLHGPASAFEAAAQRAADVFSIKIEQSGGLFDAGRVAAIADAAGIEVYGGTMLEGPVGTIASAHLFSTLTHLQWGTELFGPLLLTESILSEPLDYRDFGLFLPSGPGLGIRLDEERIDFFRRDSKRRHLSVPRA